MAVAVGEAALGQQLMPLIQIRYDLIVCFFDIETLVLLSGFCRVPAILTHRAEDLQVVIQSQLIVLQAVARSYVHAAGILCGYEIRCINAMRELLLSWHQV